MGTERVLIAGGDIPGEDPFMLILTQLIIVIGYLKPAPREEEVQVKNVFAIGLIVKAIENCLIVSLVVEGGELGRIQKPPGPETVKREEISDFRGAETQSDTPTCGTERSVGG